MSRRSKLLFLQKFIEQPSINASITPSSRFLAKKMIDDIDFSQIKTIIEFGPGTGSFTKYLIEKASSKAVIICIEYDKEYVRLLKTTYGERIVVEHGSVEDIQQICAKYNIVRPDCIISGISSRTYSHNLSAQLKHYIQQGTVFRGFGYAPHQVRSSYNNLPLKYKRFVLLNVPPAFVFGAN